jgi:diaminopimelate decarboxylase
MDLYAKVINIKCHKKPPVVDLNISIFNGIIEPLEHFEYNIKALKNSTNLSVFRVGGYSCDGYDIIKKEALLPSSLKVGDIIKIEKAGAYTFVYNNFHLKSFPKII